MFVEDRDQTIVNRSIGAKEGKNRLMVSPLPILNDESEYPDKDFWRECSVTRSQVRRRSPWSFVGGCRDGFERALE